MAWCLGGAPRAEEAVRLLRLGPWQAAGGGPAHAGAARPVEHIPMMVILNGHSRISTPTFPNTGCCSSTRQARVVRSKEARTLTLSSLGS